MILTLDGIKGAISFNKVDEVYYGKLTNVPGNHYFDGKTSAEVRDDFAKAVNAFKKVKNAG